MNSFFNSPFNHRHIFFFWITLFLSMMIYLSASLQVRSNISFFLPQNASEIDNVMQHQLKHGEAGKIILIALRGKDSTVSSFKLAEINKQLTKSLKLNNNFLSVQNGQLPLTDLMVEPYYSYRYLLQPQYDEPFSKDSLTQSFAQLLQRLQLMLSPVEQKLFAEDPQMTWLALLQQWNSQQLQKLHGVWFDKQGKQTLLFVKTRANGFDLEQQQKNIDSINERINHLINKSLPFPDSGIPSETVHEQAPASSPTKVDLVLTGAPIFALASKKAISQQIKTISVIASFTLMAFLYWFFRSIKLVLFLGLPLGFAILTGMTTVMLVDGFIHGITIAFGITIIGIAVDYPVHLYSHILFLNDRKNAHQPKKVIQSIWPMIRLGLITTLIGFSAIILSDFSGLRQLGLFAISGLFAAAMFTRFLLPLLPVTQSVNDGAFQKLLYFVHRPMPCFLRPAFMLLPVLAALYIGFHQTTLWQNDLSALSPVPQWQKQQDFDLRKAMGLPELRYALILQNPAVEELLQQSEALIPTLDDLKQQKIISGYDMAALYLPSTKLQKSRQDKLPEAKELYNRLQQALSNSDLDVTAFSPFIKAVEKSKQFQPLSAQLLMSDTSLTTAINKQSNFISDKLNTLIYRQTASALSPPLWTAIIPLQGVQTNTLKQSFFEQLSFNKESIKNLKLLDLKSQTQSMLADYRNEALLWFFSGSILILAVLFFGSRKLSHLMPLAWPFTGAVLLTIASLLFMGYSLSIFHLVTLLLVVGLGIDYSIFMFFSNKPMREGTQSPDVAQVSVIICMVSTLIMFGALGMSELPVLKAIGLTASLGAFYAFVLTIIISRPCR